MAIEGRADGIEITCDGERQLDFSDNFNHFTVEEGMHVTIDEIKGIYMNLDALDEPVGVHRAQAMCYAYIYALQHDLAEISVQLTYCNLDTIELTKTAFLGNLKYFRETFSFAELAEWFTRLTDEYKKWADFQFAWQNLRQASIKKAGVSLCIPERTERTGVGRIPHDCAPEESVYPGTHRASGRPFRRSFRR